MIQSTSPVFRFAPSPNGYLHCGHALSALLNAQQAQAEGGVLLLRIEDIDIARCRPEFEQAIIEDLNWLGIAWDGPVRRQSEHFDAYRAALAKLDAMGLIYPSFESRGEIARLAAGVDPDGAPRYTGGAKTLSMDERARRIAQGESYALRLDTAMAIARTGPHTWTEHDKGSVQADPAAWGDVVLARKDVPTSYHLSVVVDDALQGITEIVRGEDLYAATSIHRLLQALLGLPAPCYRHHRLILDPDGRKLSKSTNATALRSLRAEGATPAEIRSMVGL